MNGERKKIARGETRTSESAFLLAVRVPIKLDFMEIDVEQRRGCLNFAPNVISLEDCAIIIHDIDLLSLNGSFVSEGCENFALPEKLTNFRIPQKLFWQHE